MADLAVVGAGPAGLTAAVTAVQLGLRVVLLDAGPRPGGQYWRHPVAGPRAEGSLVHDPLLLERLLAHLPDGTAGAVTAGAGTSAPLRYLARHRVWTVATVPAGFAVHAVGPGAAGDDRPVVVPARAVLLAPGAVDRQVPFPGWDLPGVVTAGAAQALLREHGVLAGRRVVVAGTGPFLLPVAAALATGGATVVEVVEAGTPGSWARRPGTVVATPARLAEAAGYGARLARHRVRLRTGSVVLRAHGRDAVEAVTVARLDRDGGLRSGSERRVECDALAVGWGFTPQIELALALGCATQRDLDGSLVVTVDDGQQSSVAGVYVAGEATGVGGSALAQVEGELAALTAATALVPPGRMDRIGLAERQRHSLALLRRRLRLQRFAGALAEVYPVPAGWPARTADDTVVCRCEEVTAGEIRAAVRDLGATDPRAVKLLTRAGMGWCQGRICGYPTACLTADALGPGHAPDLAGLAERPVAAPLALGLLAREPEEIA